MRKNKKYDAELKINCIREVLVKHRSQREVLKRINKFIYSCRWRKENMMIFIKELAESLKDHEKAVFLQVFQYRITEKKERLRSTHYDEVSQTFTDAAAAGVEFWEIQLDFRPEGVTLYSVNRSEDL